jgi:hypothetical protein
VLGVGMGVVMVVVDVRLSGGVGDGVSGHRGLRVAFVVESRHFCSVERSFVIAL